MEILKGFDLKKLILIINYKIISKFKNGDIIYKEFKVRKTNYKNKKNKKIWNLKNLRYQIQLKIFFKIYKY